MRRDVPITVLIWCALGGWSFGQSCPGSGSVPTPDVGGAWLVTIAAPTCTLESGGYIKRQDVGTEPEKYKIHFAATVTGGCQTRVLQCSPLPCKCVNSTYYVRNLLTSEVDRNGALLGYVAASGTVQHYDTSVPTGTLQAGWKWKPLSEGKFTFTSIIKTNATQCGLSPTQSPGTPFVTNVVKCKPYYNTDPAAPERTIHLPQGPIQIYVPPSMPDLVSIADAVANDYTVGLAGTGISVTRTTSPCSGGTCVNVNIGDSTGGCTRWTAQWDTQGTVVQSEMIYPATYSEYDPTANRRYMAHELGHLLGLNESEQPDCFANHSIMSSSDPCGIAYTSAAQSPTPSDFLPIANSVYGTLPRLACGF
jgi:hypothetical protein